MATFGPVTPVLRIFDEQKAREFYVGFLGGSVEFVHRFGENFPIYMGVWLSGCALHLTEHHSDACPGALVRIKTDDIAAFAAVLRAREYKFARPEAPERMPWGALELTLTDPFGNRLVFTQDVAADERPPAMPGVTFPSS